MTVKTDTPPGLGARIRDRHHRANEYLAGSSPAKRVWGRAHLYAADVADICTTCVNNKYASAVNGLARGMGNGLIYGLCIAAFVSVFFPFITIPAVAAVGGSSILTPAAAALISTFATVTAVISAGMGIYESRQGYLEGLREDQQLRGAKIAEKICKHGHAIGDKIPKEFHKANQRVIDREHAVPAETHPQDGENHRFTDALIKSRQLESAQGFSRN